MRDSRSADCFQQLLLVTDNFRLIQNQVGDITPGIAGLRMANPHVEGYAFSCFYRRDGQVNHQGRFINRGSAWTLKPARNDNIFHILATLVKFRD